jgi:hypothetical protein
MVLSETRHVLLIGKEEGAKGLRENVVFLYGIPGGSGHHVVEVARRWDAPGVALGDVADLVIILEDHPA